jgi:hypothetical protein
LVGTSVVVFDCVRKGRLGVFLELAANTLWVVVEMYCMYVFRWEPWSVSAEVCELYPASKSFVPGSIFRISSTLHLPPSHATSHMAHPPPERPRSSELGDDEKMNVCAPVNPCTAQGLLRPVELALATPSLPSPLSHTQFSNPVDYSPHFRTRPKPNPSLPCFQKLWLMPMGRRTGEEGKILI